MVHGPYHPPSGGPYHPKIMSSKILNSYRQRVDKYYLYYLGVYTYLPHIICRYRPLTSDNFFNENRSTKVVKSFKKMGKKRKCVFIY